MKMRTGFVSNSSSSSFIVSTKDYGSVFDLAKSMIDDRNISWNTDYDDKGKEIVNLDAIDHSLVEKINKSKLDKNTPIAFTTTNYDSFIVKRGDYYLVSTCHNYEFSCEKKCKSLFTIPKEAEDIEAVFKEIHGPYYRFPCPVDEFMDFMKNYLQYASEFYWPEYCSFVKQFYRGRFYKDDMCNEHFRRKSEIKKEDSNEIINRCFDCFKKELKEKKNEN
ncbi:MAG: hypothetical protein AABY32_00650 [Nanoarchaeota archaeon]